MAKLKTGTTIDGNTAWHAGNLTPSNYAPLASPGLTGTPTAPTATAGTNTTQIATTEFVSTAVSNLVDSSPAALDTLNELAAALGDDPNFATTVTNSIATKLPLSGGTLTGTLTTQAINMQNYQLYGVGDIVFNDPGVNEGLTWSNIKIFESPDALTNAAGNFQVATGSTRLFTVRTDGSVDIPTGSLTVNGTITEAGTALSSKYLGISAKAADSDKLDGSDSTYFDHRRYTDSSNYLGGYYVSGGSEKPNNTVFGPGKFKVAMLSGSNLGFGGSWNDVMWVSTYNGGDVKSSHALVFDKYSSAVYTVDQNYDSASWGSGQRLFADDYHPNADTLTTARTINGTSFNGSANITTANWGTTRTLTIGNTGKSVNGSGNVSWSLAEIGAQAAGSYASLTHNHSASEIVAGELNTSRMGSGTATSGYVLTSDGDGTASWQAVSSTTYTHPTHPGDDINLDTGPLTGATVISDLDFNITSDTLGHITDANATYATRTLTLADLGYTGATDATNYTANQSLNTTNSPTFANLYVNDYIYHGGDTDSYIRFVAADDFQIVVGGKQVLRMDEGTDPDVLSFLGDGSNATGRVNIGVPSATGARLNVEGGINADSTIWSNSTIRVGDPGAPTYIGAGFIGWYGSDDNLFVGTGSSTARLRNLISIKNWSGVLTVSGASTAAAVTRSISGKRLLFLFSESSGTTVNAGGAIIYYYDGVGEVRILDSEGAQTQTSRYHRRFSFAKSTDTSVTIYQPYYDYETFSSGSPSNQTGVSSTTTIYLHDILIMEA